MEFKNDDKVQVNLPAEMLDAGGYLTRFQGHAGRITSVDDSDDLPYEVDFGNDDSAWFKESELRRADKFQPGDLVDWVYSDGSQRENGVWDGSKVLKRSDWGYALAEPAEGYQLLKPDGKNEGWIAADELVPHKEPKTEVKIIPYVENPDAPTVAELNSGIDISEYIAKFGLSQPHGLNALSIGQEDVVSEPAHYKAGMPEGIEVRDIIKAQGIWKEFCHGNMIKYTLRWKYKNGIEDLKKMLQYGQWLVEELEAED